MPLTVTRESFRSTLIEFAIVHAKPDGDKCRTKASACPQRLQIIDEFEKLTKVADLHELIDYFLEQLILEARAIARTRHNDGQIPLTGFAFDSSTSTGILAGALMMGAAHGHEDLDQAARTIVRFGPPSLAVGILSLVIEQLVSSMVERAQQMLGTTGSQ